MTRAHLIRPQTTSSLCLQPLHLNQMKLLVHPQKKEGEGTEEAGWEKGRSQEEASKPEEEATWLTNFF